MKNAKIILATVITATIFSGFAYAKTNDNKNTKPAASVAQQLKQYQLEEQKVAKNLKVFDTLDFDVYSNQKWDRLTESHDKDILVHYPDGSTTKGLDAHVEMLKPMFVFAPDTKIKEHPISFGSKNWTSVTGVIEGTFTQPMPLGNGKFIQPTGKKFKLPMATIGHWNSKGVMDEETLYWDNQELMRQILPAQ